METLRRLYNDHIKYLEFVITITPAQWGREFYASPSCLCVRFGPVEIGLSK